MTLTPSEVASLSKWLNFWEWSEYIAEAIVILGCVGEIIAEKLVCLKKHKKESFEFWSGIVLVGGLLLSLTALIETSRLSGKVIGSLGDQAKEAAAKAQGASTDAGTALTNAGNASADALKAAQTAKSARDEADSFERDIVSAKRQAADAESHLADALERANAAQKDSIRLREVIAGWQLDDTAKKRFAKEVRGFVGTPFDLAANTNEAAFMEELDGILTSPDVAWKRLEPKTGPNILAIWIDGKAAIVMTSGIVLEVDEDQQQSLKPAIIALGKALKDGLGLPTINLHIVPKGSWGNRIHIIIGKRQ